MKTLPVVNYNTLKEDSITMVAQKYLLTISNNVRDSILSGEEEYSITIYECNEVVSAVFDSLVAAKYKVTWSDPTLTIKIY